MSEEKEKAKNWPFKTDNNKEALDLGRALIELLAEPGAEIVIKRRTYFLDAQFRAEKLGRDYQSRQSCWNGEHTIAQGVRNIAIARDIRKEADSGAFEEALKKTNEKHGSALRKLADK